MKIQVDKFNLTSDQHALTCKLIDSLQIIDENFHSREGIISYDCGELKYNSVAAALYVAKIPFVDDYEAWLKHGKLSACFDIDYDNSTIESTQLELYGWNNFVHWHELRRGLNYLDSRLCLTYKQIAAVINEALTFDSNGTIWLAE